jgi:hypothetical protein
MVVAETCTDEELGASNRKAEAVAALSTFEIHETRTLP